MAKSKTAPPEKPETPPAVTPRVGRPQPGDAGECPQNADHPQTKVYKTLGRKRYCKCNDCGATWTTVGPYADPLRDYAQQLVETLESASASPADDGTDVYVIDAAVVEEIVSELRTRIAA